MMTPPLPKNKNHKSDDESDDVRTNRFVVDQLDSSRNRHHPDLGKQNSNERLAESLHTQDFVQKETHPLNKHSYTPNTRRGRNDSLSNGSFYAASVNLHTGYAAQSNAHYVLVGLQDNDKDSINYARVHANDVHREGGLFTKVFVKQALVMSLWFFSSFATIVLNKYILSTLDLDAGILGETQILMTTFYGGIMMLLPFCRSFKSSEKHQVVNKYKFCKTITLLGCLRCGAVICSVIGLKYVAVSFSETIKSSAPLFTAIMAYILLGEYSGLYVNLSLLPIMFGLGLSTYTEISFNMTGFVAAVSNNILDCIQNVFSKKLLCNTDHKYSPLELQFYTSVAATVIQMPLWFYFMDVHSTIHQLDRYAIYMLLFNSVIFYAQSLFAYLLMSLISPITFSVSNTVKRAGLIWFSILVFGNSITILNGLGTVLVVAGVFLYQRARHVEANQRLQMMEEKMMSLANRTTSTK